MWSEAYLQGKLQLENILLTLITTERVSVNSAASRLSSSSFTPRNTDEILELLLAVAQSSENKINKPAYAAFLRLSQDQQRMLLKNIRILDGSPDILAVQKEAVNYLRLSTREKFLQAVYERLEGWWFATAIKHLSSHTSTIIQYRDLHVMLNDIQEQFYEENLPLDYLEPLEAKEHEAEEDQRVFVEQLRLIDVRIKRIQKAIGDFYRSSSQRSRWVRDGVLFMNELEQYEARLCDEWERRYEIMQENFPHNPTEEDIQKCGKTLFNEIEQASLHIRSRCTAEYIMRGSYHILADQLHVGWHVNFRSRLRKMLP